MSSRSDMQLLGAFKDFAYLNEIGPGGDIHTANIPDVALAFRGVGEQQGFLGADGIVVTRILQLIAAIAL